MVEDDLDTLQEIKGEVDTLEARVAKMEFARMLSGDNDHNNAILSVNVGQGGVEFQDAFAWQIGVADGFHQYIIQVWFQSFSASEDVETTGNNRPFGAELCGI